MKVGLNELLGGTATHRNPEMMITVKIEVHTAWWWNWLYLPAANFLIESGMEPDLAKVSAMAERAVRIKIVEVPPNYQ